MLRREECASSMGQQRRYAAARDAQTKSSKEECALSMEQRSNDASSSNAQIKPGREEYVGDTEQTKTPRCSTANRWMS